MVDAALIAELRRFMTSDVPAETARRALDAARHSYPSADAAWLVERAAYLIRRKIVLIHIAGPAITVGEHGPTRRGPVDA